jgi:LPXTG-motif cell wall-anchored protein
MEANMRKLITTCSFIALMVPAALAQTPAPGGAAPTAEAGATGWIENYWWVVVLIVVILGAFWYFSRRRKQM